VCTSAPTRTCKTGCGNKIIPVLLSLQDQAPGVELLTDGFQITQREEGRNTVSVVRLAKEFFVRVTYSKL